MSSDNSNNNGGIGFVGLLAIVFITLKLTGYIDWTWFWVLSPLWISFLIGIVALIVVAVIAWKTWRGNRA